MYRICIELFILIILVWLFIILAGRALKRIAVAQIAEISNTKIKARSINFDLNGSVFIEGLVIRSEEQAEDANAILEAENVYAKFSVTSLMLFRPRLKEISVEDFSLNVQYDLDAGEWNVASIKIKPPKSTHGKMPLINLQDGTLEYTKVQNNQVKTIAAIPLDVRFGFVKDTPNAYSFSITTAQRDGFSGKSTLTGLWKPGNITVSGGISSADISDIEKAWMVYILAADLNYDKESNYSLKLRVKDLLKKDRPVSETLTFVEPLLSPKAGPVISLQNFFNQFNPRGNVDIELAASGNLAKIMESKVTGWLDCRDIWVNNNKFPYPIEQLKGRVDFTENSVKLNALHGRHGDVELVVSGQIENFGPNSHYQFRMQSANMALDEDLYKALRLKQQRLWDEFSPTGIAAIDYKNSKKAGGVKNTSLMVELFNVDAVYQNFPYPLEGLTGTLSFDPNNITISNLVSEFQGSKIILNGKVTGLKTQKPVYEINVKADCIHLDATLNRALSKNQQQFYSKIDMASQYGRGLISFVGRFWTIKEDSLKRYHMLLNIRPLELNKELFAILPGPMQGIANDLNPVGNVNVMAVLSRMDKSEVPDYTVTVDFLDNTMNYKNFRYPLKDVQGYLVIEKDNIELKDITAVCADNIHIAENGSSVKLNGQIFLADNDFGSANLQFYASDIFFDEHLSLALPEKIRPNYDKLAPTGRFDLNFDDIKVFTDYDGENYIDFNGNAVLKECNFNLSPEISGLNATIQTKGLYKTGYGLNRAEFTVDADSLRFLGKALSNLNAKLNYDYNSQTWSARNLIAECYDGMVAGNFELKKGDDNRFEYSLNVGFDDINLRKFLAEANSQKDPNGYTIGQMNGSLSICGLVDDQESSIGRCRLQIEKMKVGKLSIISKMLNVLKLTEPTDYAFDKMVFDSYMKNNYLSFEQLDLSGKSLAFKGVGDMNLENQDINLILTARGTRLAVAEPTIWQSLADAISSGVVRIDVTGTYDEPTIKTTALPVIKGVFGLLGTEKIK